ncbi:MAG: WYL domain-containing protein, partial [Ruminococcus sp.]|nr:WYL domain-containing protein [Ruminococcus sp.]
IIMRYGFRDSMLFLPQKLIPKNSGEDWGFLRKNEQGEFISAMKNRTVNIFTEIQKSWLKSKLDDPKINLFIGKNTQNQLKKRLENTACFADRKHLRYTDQFSDGDNFCDEGYIKNFRTVIRAVKRREVLEIIFLSGRGKKISGKYFPLKMQYSLKNDRFRLFCFTVRDGRISDSGVINIGRIIEVKNTGCRPDDIPDMDSFFQQRKCREPVTVRIFAERNAPERFFMEFAPYEKYTESIEDDGSYIIKMWYDYQEETELLIRLLGFGSVAEVVSPSDFRRKISERIAQQYKWFYKN